MSIYKKVVSEVDPSQVEMKKVASSVEIVDASTLKIDGIDF